MSKRQFEALVAEAGAGATLKAKAIRGGGFTMGAEGVDFLLRVGSIMVLARLLVPEHFGLIGMVTAVTGLAERIKDFGLAIATVQRETITHEQISALFWINGALGLGTAALVALLAWPMARFYGDERVLHITLAIALNFVWSGFAVQHLGLLRRAMRFKAVAFVQIGSSAASIAIAIAAALAGAGYWALVVREVARSLLFTAGVWLSCRWIPGRPVRGTGVRSMIAFGANLSAVQMAYEFSANFGHVLMGRLFGAHPLGVFRQGVQLVSGPINQLIDPINSVAESTLSRVQNEPETYRSYYRKLVTLVAGTTMPIITYIFVHAEAVVAIVLGSGWEDAAPVFRWLALAGWLYPSVGTIGAVMVTCGFGHRYFRIAMLNAGLLVVLSLIGSQWGPQGIAAAPLGTMLLMLAPRLFWGLRNTPVNATLVVASILRPAGASLLMGAAMAAFALLDLTAGPVTALICGALVGLVAYVAAWALLPGGRNQLTTLLGDVRSALRR
jgi:PST family polysaccharide transporter